MNFTGTSLRDPPGPWTAEGPRLQIWCIYGVSRYIYIYIYIYMCPHYIYIYIHIHTCIIYIYIYIYIYILAHIIYTIWNGNSIYAIDTTIIYIYILIIYIYIYCIIPINVCTWLYMIPYHIKPMYDNGSNDNHSNHSNPCFGVLSPISKVGGNLLTCSPAACANICRSRIFTAWTCHRLFSTSMTT